MLIENIKLAHCIAKQTKDNKWEPATTRYYKRENGSMGVFQYDNEYDAIDKERQTRKEMFGDKVKEHIYICSGQNPYSGEISSWKYSSRTGLPIDFIVKDKPIKEIIREIIMKNLIKDGEWIQIECI